MCLACKLQTVRKREMEMNYCPNVVESEIQLSAEIVARSNVPLKFILTVPFDYHHTLALLMYFWTVLLLTHFVIVVIRPKWP